MIKNKMSRDIFLIKCKWLMISLSFIICHLSFSPARAQTLTGSAPSHVAVGEQFRLTYTVNTQDVSDFRAGNIPDELEVLIGPNRSAQSSYTMINGHASSSSSITLPPQKGVGSGVGSGVGVGSAGSVSGAVDLRAAFLVSYRSVAGEMAEPG